MQKIPVAMIGGGPQSMIGQTHRNALNLSGKYKLVAGSFSPSIDKSQHVADNLATPVRVYADWREMLAIESQREDGARAVIIVTPDYLHYANAKAALDHNFHVICDKPLCENKEQAQELFDLAQKKKKCLAVTYTISGDPTYRAFKHFVRREDFGSIYQVEGLFMAGWAYGLPEFNESHLMHKQAWRLQEGKGLGALGDIATHIFEYSHQLIGIKPERITGSLQKTYKERALNDGGHILICYPDNLLMNIRFSLSLTQENRYKITVNALEQSAVYHVGDDYFTVHETQGKTRKIQTPIEYLAPDYKEYISFLEEGTERTQEKFNNIFCFKNLYDDFADSINNNIFCDEEMRLNHPGLNGMKLVSYIQKAEKEKCWVMWM